MKNDSYIRLRCPQSLKNGFQNVVPKGKMSECLCELMREYIEDYWADKATKHKEPMY